MKPWWRTLADQGGMSGSEEWMRIGAIAKQAISLVATPEPRKGSASPCLDEREFKRRFRSQFPDEAFEPLQLWLDRLAAAA